MGELVGDREHLRRLVIGVVYEYQRRVLVNQSEALELIVDRAYELVLLPTTPIEHDDNTGCLGMVAKESDRTGPRVGFRVPNPKTRPGRARISLAASTVFAPRR